MNIQNEKTNEPVQEIIITITAEDYAENVEKALKKERRTAQIPGFRVGMAPMGMIKRAYEKHFTMEEVNRLLGEKLYGYLQEKNLKILGEPLPIDEKTSVDFDKNDPFVFAFEYALEPEVKIDYAKLPAAKNFKVVASDNEKQKFIDNLRNRHGEYTSPETIGEEDSVSVHYDEKDGFLFIHDLTAAGKKALVGKKNNDEVKVSLKKIFPDNALLSRFLKIKEEELAEDNAYETTLQIRHIGRMIPAEVNDDFFKKAYPDGSVTNMEQLNAVAAKEIEAQWASETDRYFMNNAIGVLIDNVKIELPDAFLKRFIVASQENVTAETIEEKYPEYQKSFCWQLIENALVKENNIQVSQDEVKAFIRDFFVKNYFGNFNDESVKDQLDSLVANAMKNQQDVKSIYDQIFDKKIMDVLRSKLKTEEKSGTFEDFIAFASNKEEAKPAKKKAAPKKKAETAEEPAAETKAPAKKTAAKKTTKKEE